MVNNKFGTFLPLLVGAVLFTNCIIMQFPSFHWGSIILIGVPLLSYILNKTSSLKQNFLIYSYAVGMIMFISLPSILGIFGLMTLGHRLTYLYKPASINPKLLFNRNLASFIFLGYALIKIIILLMDREFALLPAVPENVLVLKHIFLLIVFGSFLTLLTESFKAYDKIHVALSKRERNWTNNVFALLSHNIRTPIATLGNRIEIIQLKMKAAATITEEDIEFLNQDRIRVNSIVNSLLSSASRSIISEGSGESISLLSVLQEFKHRVQIKYPSGVDFNFGTNDRIALDLALESVISNSEKYGATEIQLILNNNKEEVTIEVIDNGEGMNETTLMRYGTPFNNSDSKEGGSGLGVYFSLQLILGCGWNWSVNSTKGEGTSVLFSIPKATLVL